MILQLSFRLTRGVAFTTLISVFLGAGMLVLSRSPAAAFSIELNDVAPLRVEWQRKFARGERPFPHGPSLATLTERLSERGFTIGTPMYVRMFKAESEMEIWLLRGHKYVLFETYPICNWSGSIGPKLAEGDKQNPEGFYSIGANQLRRIGRWPKSINIGFPNKYDKSRGRTGSYILLHGGCSSVGCFAMTDPGMNEIQELSAKAIRKGQKRFQLHIYPFRMTNRNLEIFAKNKWYSFWKNLKQGFDNFERTNIPPRINVCGEQYLVEDAGPDELIQQKPMRKLRMIKFGQEPLNGETCYAQPEDSETASGTGDAIGTTPKGSMQQTSTTHERTKF